MKKIFILFSFVSCLLFVNSANALLPVGMSFGLRGGNSFSSIKNVSTNTSKDSKFFIAPNLGIKLFSLRGEVEYIYRHNFLKVNNTSTKAESTMFNLYYNFFSLYFAKLYVNGGYGTTKFSLNSTNKSNNTYSVGIGANLSFFDTVNIDAGYRYMDMGKINSTKMDSHDVYVGLRFGF
jgi:opacity protein-like surface antigen